MSEPEAPPPSPRPSEEPPGSGEPEPARDDGGGPDGPPPRPPRRLDARAAVGVFLLFVLAQLAGGFVALASLELGGVLETPAPDDPEALRALQDRAAPALVLGSALGGALLVALALRRFPHDRLRELAPEGGGLAAGPARHLVTGALVGVLVALASQLLIQRLAEPPPPEEMGTLTRMAASPGTPRLAVTLLALAIAPPVEEILFRGLLLRGFARSWGTPAAAGLVTALFVLLHATELAFFPPATLGVAGVGLATLALRLQAGAVGPAVACHLAYNACVMVAVLAPRA